MDQKELLAALMVAAETPISHVDLSASTQRIKVDMDTRKITGHKEFGVIKDHLAENIIFEVKRYKGDTDLAEKDCAIHWENGENGGVLPVTEVDLSEDGLILMRWELSDEFTQYAGSIAYALHFFSILDGGFTYHAATNAAVGTLGTTLNASAHSKNKITPSEIEVYIAKMNELSAAMDEQVVLAQEAATKAESIAEQLAEKTGQIDLNTRKNSQHDSEIAALTQSKSDAITVEKSGTSIVATDSSDKGFEQFRTYGWSKQEKTSGKQLLEYPYYNTTTTVNGITFTDNGDGSITISGTATAEARFWIRQGVIAVNDGDAVTVSRNKKIEGVVIDGWASDWSSFFTNSALALNDLSQSGAISSNNILLSITVKKGTTVNETIKVMLNAGTEALPWEPYTGGIPSPNPKYQHPIVSAGQMLVDGVVTDVGISKKLTGKNLLKIIADNLLTNTSGVITKDGSYRSAIVNVKNITDIYISGDFTLLNSGVLRIGLCIEYPVAGGAAVRLSKGENTNIVVSAYNYVLLSFLRDRDSGATFDEIINSFMVNEGKEALPYEPYTEQTLTLNHVLRGIPLGTDIPEMFKTNALHMDGIYWDEKEQQYYIADTIDAERGVLVQRVAKYILTSDTVFDTNELATLGRVRITRNDAVHVGKVRTACLMCDSLTVSTVGNIYDCFQYEKAIVMYLGVDNTDDLATFMEGNTITIHYILATPIETPLTDEEIIAYKALHSNKPTTIITNNAGCMMEVAYVADPKNHIEQNYVPVSKYTALEERVSALEQLHV